MPVSTEKDFQSKIEKLENWLASKEGPLKLTPHESSMASGFSNETFIFDLQHLEFVLRNTPNHWRAKKLGAFDQKFEVSALQNGVYRIDVGKI